MSFGIKSKRFSAIGAKLTCWAFIFLWLIPISLVGLLHRSIPIIPAYFNDLYSISHLFIRSIENWSIYFYQVQLSDNLEWINIDESKLSTMQPFGHRTRLTRAIYLAENFENKKKMREEIAGFIKNRYERLNSGKFVSAVRFIKVEIPVGGVIAKPEGHWKKTPIEMISPELQQSIATVNFN